MEKSCRSPARIPLRFCASNRARTRGGQCARAASRKINGDASTPTSHVYRIVSLYGHSTKRKSSDLREAKEGGRDCNRNWGNRVARDEIKGSGCYTQLSSRADRFRRPSGIERLVAKTTLLLDSNPYLPSTIRSDDSHVNFLRGKFKSISRKT